MLHLLTITPKLFGLPMQSSAADRPPGWQLQARCETAERDSCVFIQQLTQLARSSHRDGRAALQAMDKLLRVAATGLPLENFYDKKQCHEVHGFTHQGAPHKIWRIRQGDVRIYFYYAAGKIIYLSAVAAKRKDRLTPAETRRLADEIILYLDAEASNKLAEAQE